MAYRCEIWYTPSIFNKQSKIIKNRLDTVRVIVYSYNRNNNFKLNLIMMINKQNIPEELIEIPQ